MGTLKLVSSLFRKIQCVESEQKKKIENNGHIHRKAGDSQDPKGMRPAEMPNKGEVESTGTTTSRGWASPGKTYLTVNS